MQNIIILDDQTVFYNHIVEYLQKEYSNVFNFHKCTNSTEFYDMVNKLNFCLVISELKIYSLENFKPQLNFDVITYCSKKKIPCLIYSMLFNPNYILKCLNLGAGGFVVKIADSIHLKNGIENLLKGGKYLCNISKYSTSNGFSEFEKIEYPLLTKRQIEIFRLKTKGLEDIEIGNILSIEICSVRKHRQIARRKNACNNDELIQMINFWFPNH